MDENEGVHNFGEGGDIPFGQIESELMNRSNQFP